MIYDYEITITKNLTNIIPCDKKDKKYPTFCISL